MSSSKTYFTQLVWHDLEFEMILFFRLYLSWCSSLAGEVLAPPSLSQLHSYSLPCAEFEMKVGVASMLTVRAASLISIKDYCSHWHHKGGRVEKTEQLWPYLVWASTHVKAYMWHTWGKWWKAKYVLLKTVAFLNLKDFIQRILCDWTQSHKKYKTWYDTWLFIAEVHTQLPNSCGLKIYISWICLNEQSQASELVPDPSCDACGSAETRMQIYDEGMCHIIGEEGRGQ